MSRAQYPGLTVPLPSAMCMANLNSTAGHVAAHKPGTRRGTILPLNKDLFGAQAYVKGGIGNYVAQVWAWDPQE